jgi:hypothetical protein
MKWQLLEDSMTQSWDDWSYYLDGVLKGHRVSTLLDMISDSKRHVAQADLQRESIALMLGKHGMESGFVAVVSFDEVHLFCQ